MSILAQSAAALAASLLTIQVASAAIAMVRCRKGAPVGTTSKSKNNLKGITIVRPLCGLEPYSQETIEASFQIDWPDYELIFCVADAQDPIVPLAQTAIDRHPHVPARLLFGMERLGPNPKLNNMAKGFRNARFDIIVFVDSNLLVAPDYLHRLTGAWRADAGMVTAPAFGDRPEGFWSLLECAMLNSYQARIQYAVDTLGSGFAQGKSLMFRRADLERGGLESLASEPAEDAAATKMMRGKARGIAVAGPPYPQLLGRRSLAQVWGRHLRWARLRRASFPVLFAPEIFSGVLPPLAAALVAAHGAGINLLAATVVFLAVWYIPEWLLTRIAGWPRSAALLPAMLLRDILLPALYFCAFFGRSVTWNGNKVDLAAAPKRRVLQRPQIIATVLSAGSARLARVSLKSFRRS
ncbi:MAG: hypothetical protein BGP04_23480 [Rhizobiales bacterium 62-17]|nr:glycosyltransferase [Hyphomicrobiales bacterium]OJY00517.1 MAG: hypothetical protein BGP04_23480 [Rhizobiales bacterium 62-17]